jgi:hypothetical protein
MKRNITRQEVDRLIHRDDVIVIRHVHGYGGNPLDRWMWQAELNGEVYDWHRKDELIRQAEKMKLMWIVLRLHRDNTYSIMQSSVSFTPVMRSCVFTKSK